MNFSNFAMAFCLLIVAMSSDGAPLYGWNSNEADIANAGKRIADEPQVTVILANSRPKLGKRTIVCVSTMFVCFLLAKEPIRTPLLTAGTGNVQTSSQKMDSR